MPTEIPTFSPEEAWDEAQQMRGKIKAGLASNYPEAESLVEEEKGLSSNEILTPEIENLLIAEAEKHVTDIINYKRDIPVRHTFSGYVSSAFEKGFKYNSFVIDRGSKGYDYKTLFYTKNEGFTQGNYYNIDDCLHNKDLNLEIEWKPEEDPDDKYARFPELNETIREKKATNTHTRYHVDPEKVKRLIIDAMGESTNESLIWDVIKNLVKGIEFEEWSFEEKELWYDSVVKHFINRENRKSVFGIGKIQVYDMALIIDPSQIKRSRRGYLEDEREISAPAKSILGVIYTNYYPNINREYLIEKMKRIYAKNPALARPIYNNDGSLIWPRQMSHEEVKQLVAARKKIKPEESDPDSVE